MEIGDGKRDCWPTRDQLLLLKAALLDGEQALSAWAAWRAMVELEELDHASHRMLPLLYHNLAKLGVQDDWMDKMKGVYRRTWYENRMLFHNMHGILKAFQEAGIETMILKGTALILLHYKNYGLRGMGDFDILVRTEDAVRSMNVVDGLGWKPVWMDVGRKGLTEITQSCDYEDGEGRRFDLHWHVMLECCTRDADAEFWRSSVPVAVHDVHTRALAATDQLLHVCVHGARWDPTPPFRWIADAVVILKTSAMDLDWSRLLLQARERQLLLPMRDTLKLLKEEFNADIPASVLRELQASKPTIIERIEYSVRTQPVHQTGPFAAFVSNYWYYSRLRNNESMIRKLIGLPRFLQEYWGAASIWHLPFIAVFRTVRRTLKLIRFSIEKPLTIKFSGDKHNIDLGTTQVSAPKFSE